MSDQWVDLATPDGPMRTYVARPQTGRASAGIVVFQEAFGVNEHIRDVAGRFAKLGLLAAAPELFHRTAPRFEAPYDTEGSWAAIEPHYKSLTAGGLSDDAQAAFDFLRAQGAATVASAGFCLGGRASYVANARTSLAAAISFYGGGIAPDLLDLARDQHGPILMFWGGLDANIKAEHYRAVADALDRAEKTHEQVLFSHAGHGFFCDRRKSYNAQAAEQAWALSVAFLRAYGVV